MQFLVLFLEDVLVVFDLLKLVLGCRNGRGLAADDVLHRINKLPHLFSGDSTGRVQWCEGITAPGSPPVLIE